MATVLEIIALLILVVLFVFIAAVLYVGVYIYANRDELNNGLDDYDDYIDEE